jgi:hypothetical protein
MANFDTRYSFEIEELDDKDLALLSQMLADAGLTGYEIDTKKKSCWFYDDDAGEFHELTDTLLSFSIHYNKPIRFSYANTCDRPVLDAFDGGYVIMYKGNELWIPNAWTISAALDKFVEEVDDDNGKVR